MDLIKQEEVNKGTIPHKPYSLEEIRLKKHANGQAIEDADIDHWRGVMLANIQADQEMIDIPSNASLHSNKTNKTCHVFDHDLRGRKENTNKIKKTRTFIATYSPGILYERITRENQSFNAIWEEIKAWAKETNERKQNVTNNILPEGPILDTSTESNSTTSSWNLDIEATFDEIRNEEGQGSSSEDDSKTELLPGKGQRLVTEMFPKAQKNKD